MKKYFIFAFAVLTAVAMFSCKEKNPGGGETPENPGETTKNGQVVLNVHELEIPVGGQEKLRAAVSPVKENVVIAYTSENEAVATVNNSGLVSGVAAGVVNIIASADGYTSDTCVVTVIDASDAFAWGGMFVSRDDNYVVLNDKDTIIEYINDGTEGGTPVHCILVSGSGFAWDQNIFLDNTSQTGLAGQGYFTFIDRVPVLQIVDSIDDNGKNFYYFSASAVYFVDAQKFDETDTTYAYCAAAGAMGDPAKQLAYWTSEEEGLEPGITGAEIWYMDASTFRGYPTVGLVGTGVLQGSTSEAYYRMNIGWFEEESSYGLKVVEGAEGYELKDPAEWAAIEYKEYAKLPESSQAPRRALKLQAPNTKMDQFCKQLKAMKKDRMYKAK